MEKKLWFKAKEYGWGWYPVTMEGWGVLGLYLIGLFSSFFFLETISPKPYEAMIFFPNVIILTIFLILVCYLTGEKPEWRWGKKTEEKKEAAKDNGSRQN